MVDDDSETSLMEEISMLESQMSKIEDDISNLWYSCIMPYIQNHNRQILTDLTELDKNRFYKLMVSNNRTYLKLKNSLTYLRQQAN